MITLATDTDSSGYTLECLSTGESISDRYDPAVGNLPLANPGATTAAFLRTRYKKRVIDVDGPEAGLYRFRDWLPLRRELSGSSAPVTYKSTALAGRLGAENLWITFSGYWPERNVRMVTGTFKECEAYSVYGRMPEQMDSTLVVASAGNTARAFLQVASENNLPLVVVVPEENLPGLWTVGPRSASTIVIAASDGADYTDAIDLASIVTEIPGFVPEGGARNVARRDGMATTMLSAAWEIGRTPDHYFQAVGSGTGAIAAWEANLRLIADGRFGSHKTTLHLAQNAPFLLLVDSWKRQSRELVPLDVNDAKRHVADISAKVLANRKPPYSPVGGVFDALNDCSGRMYGIENDTATRMANVFRESEGIDITAAAAIACGALEEAIDTGAVDKNDTIMLNITGGGVERALRELPIEYVVPDIVAAKEMWNRTAMADALSSPAKRR